MSVAKNKYFTYLLTKLSEKGSPHDFHCGAGMSLIDTTLANVTIWKVDNWMGDVLNYYVTCVISLHSKKQLDKVCQKVVNLTNVGLSFDKR